MLVNDSIFFDWKLFWVIFFIALPGLFWSLGGFTRTWWPHIRTHHRNPGKVLTLATFGALTLSVTIAAIATGILLAPTVNARFIYFQALINDKNKLQAFLFEFLPGLFIGFPSALIFLFGYYTFFRKHLTPQNRVGAASLGGENSASFSEKIAQRIDEKTVFTIERLRNLLGLGVRLFFNAIVGEVIFRWGIQSFFIFLFLKLTGNLYASTIFAIIIAGLLNGCVHMISLVVITHDKTNTLKVTTLILDTGIALIFGILFWRFGIVSAITAHLLLHIIWYPLDIFYFRRIPADE